MKHKQLLHCFNPETTDGPTTVCRALIAHIPTVIVSITQVWTRDADIGRLTFCVLWLTGSLRWENNSNNK